MQFTKMHGLGNDYVYVDCFSQHITDPAGLARRVSDRHYGIGADGLILVMPSDKADARMRIFNADGSEAEMCGNGLRCFAKYVHDHGLTSRNPLRIETGAGVLTVQFQLGPDGKVSSATVDMGEPILEPARIPVNLPGERAVDVPLEVMGRNYRMTCVSMGNPHAVIFVEEVAHVDLPVIGPAIEMHPLFPRRVNVHFVEVHGPGEVTVRTWERGSGITLACGTGASAVCVAGVLNRKTGREITAHLPGGDLRLIWQTDNHVHMTGPAVEVFSGTWAPQP